MQAQSLKPLYMALCKPSEQKHLLDIIDLDTVLVGSL